MNRIDINCPRCNHPQKFGKRKEEISPGYFQIYIQCKKCRWKEVIIEGDNDIIHTQRDIARLKAKIMGDPSLKNVLRRKQEINEQLLDKGRSNKKAT
jgi:hypothetical protein